MRIVAPALAASMAACTELNGQPLAQTSHATQEPPSHIWPLGHWSADEQAVQTWLTQMGVGLLHEPQLTFWPQLFWTVPQEPGAHGFVGVQPQAPAVPPPPQVSGAVQLTQAPPAVPQTASVVPAKQMPPSQQPVPLHGTEQVPSPWQVAQPPQLSPSQEQMPSA
jgi:hypothetical protein